MKKCFFVGLLISIVPVMCLGESVRFTQLVREKQRKMEELEKCMGSSKGLKIAGLSTLGLTAVGVTANVVEAQKIKEYETKKTAAEKDIEKFNKEIAKIKECEDKNQVYKDGECSSSKKVSQVNLAKGEVVIRSFDYGDNGCNTFSYKDGNIQDADCNGLSMGEWDYKMEHETAKDYIKGKSGCFAANSSATINVSKKGEYCWCQVVSSTMEDFKKNDFKWLYNSAETDETKCSETCARNCINKLEDDDYIQRLFR